MTAYNEAQFIHEAIGSILSQTLSDLELVVIDDGSSDGTAGIIRDLAASDRRLQAHFHARVGRVKALNLAIAQTNSPLIALMDADDRCAPDRLARQVAFLASNRDCDLVSCATRRIDTRGRVIKGMQSGRERPAANATMVIRSEVMKRFGYRYGYRSAEDYDLYLRLRDADCRMESLPIALYDYRVNRRSTSHARRDEQITSSVNAKISQIRRKAGLEDFEFNDPIDEPISVRWEFCPPDLRQELARYLSRKMWESLSLVSRTSRHRALEHLEELIKVGAVEREDLPRLRRLTWASIVRLDFQNALRGARRVLALTLSL